MEKSIRATSPAHRPGRPRHQRPPARRTVQGIAAAVAVALLGMFGINLLAGGTATAAVLTGPHWDTNTGRTGYDAMLTDIRDAVMSGPLYGQTEAETTNRNYLLVTLVNDRGFPGSDTVRLLLRTDNLYLVGWDRGASTTLYHFSDQSPELPAGDDSAVLPFDSTYAGMGVARQGMLMQRGDLEGSITALSQFRGGTVPNAVREGLVRFAQAISEAARFGPIAQNIGSNLESTSSYRMSSDDVALENNWDNLSTAMRRSLNNGTPIDVTAGSQVFNTLQSVAAVLLLALMTSSL